MERRFGSRVRTVVLTGDEAEDRERMRQAAPGPIDCVLRMVQLLKSGLLDLNAFDVTEFALDDANDANGAVAFAAANGGPFRLTVICP